MQCPKCNGEMTEKDKYESGNIRFQRYSCGDCYTEQSQALGIANQVPEE